MEYNTSFTHVRHAFEAEMVGVAFHAFNAVIYPYCTLHISLVCMYFIR